MKLTDQWLEVFRAGSYGEKGSYTEADLDKIVQNYKPSEHEAPVVIGHPKDNGPAWGWVEGLKRVGNTLMAKLRQVHPQFEQMVAEGMFKKRSISLYTEPKLGLRHLGFLGAMPPEVKGLADPVFRDGKYADIPFVEEEVMEPKDVVQAVKDGLKDFFEKLRGGRSNEPVLFTQDEVNKAIETGVTAGTKPLADQLKTLSEGLAAAQKENKEFREKLEKQSTAATFSAAVEKQINRLKTDRKWIKAYDEMGLPQVFESLAGSETVLEFKEGDKTVKKPVLEVLADFCAALPSFVSLKEISQGAQPAKRGTVVKFNEPAAGSKSFVDSDSADLAEAAGQYAKEHKVSYGEALTIVRREGIKKATAATANAV
jgi:hypothetical protein